MTALAAGATQLHELSASFVAAGFRRPEALELAKEVMRNSMPDPAVSPCPQCGWHP